MERSQWIPASNGKICLISRFVFVLSFSFLLHACDLEIGTKSDNKCTPDCPAYDQEAQCKDDGCGSICPCIDVNELCNLEQECVSADGCAGGCDGRTCGSVCGEPCGECSDGEKCVDGQCECAPQCDGVHCGQDDGCESECGCGDGQACIDGLCVDGEDPCAAKECGTWSGQNCGTCDGELLCSAQGQCVTECDDVCGDVGWQCGGTICHDECGPCSSGDVCVNHVCECQPSCPSGYCGNDGCGGSCACGTMEKCDSTDDKCVACTDADSCDSWKWECGTVCGEPCGECSTGETCVDGSCVAAALKLMLVSADYSDADERVHGTVQVEYIPPENSDRPRIADIRIDTSRTVSFEIDSLTLGIAATQSGKTLYLDPISQKPWRYRPDGSVQMLVHTDVENLEDASAVLSAGMLLVVNFSCTLTDDDASTGVLEDTVKLFLVRRNQIFAPFESDLALQETAYDTAVVVKK